MVELPLRCLVFDCDGVLLDSVGIKTRAFARLAESYGKEARDRLLMHHRRFGGVSRYEKFRWLLEDLGREVTPGLLDSLGRRFAGLVAESIRTCPLLPGVEAVLSRWQGVLPLYVCSGTPQAELRQVLDFRKLAEFFSGIYGSPPGKSALLRKIIDDCGFQPEELLMIGDTSTDMQAAETAGTLFYGIGQDFAGGRWPWSPDLRALNKWLESRS